MTKKKDNKKIKKTMNKEKDQKLRQQKMKTNNNKDNKKMKMTKNKRRPKIKTTINEDDHK